MKLKNVVLLLSTLYAATTTVFAMDTHTEIDKKVEELIEKIENISLNENKIQLSEKAYQEISQDCEEKLNQKNHNQLIKLAKKIDLKKLDQQFSSHNNKKKNNPNKSEVPKTSVQTKKQTQKISQNKNNTSKNKKSTSHEHDNSAQPQKQDDQWFNKALEQNKKEVEKLLEKDEAGNTALHRAIIAHDFKTIETCLKNKIHEKARVNNNGFTAYCLALNLKNKKALELFHTYGYTMSKLSIFPIHQIRSSEGLKNYSKKDLLIKTNRGETLLHMVCQDYNYDHFKFIKELIEVYNFSCDTQDFYTYQTPLHAWMDDPKPTKQKEEIALYLLKNMKYIDQKDCDGLTLLHYAITCNYLRVVIELLKRGAYVNAECHDGNTPLHFAVDYDFPDIIGILLNNKAYPKIANRDGKIAYQMISELTDKKTKKLIELIQWQSKEKPHYEILHYYCINKSKKEIETLLINYGINRNAIDDNGLTPLMYAIKEKRADIIPLLVQYGCLLTARSVDGNNILHYAYACGDEKTLNTVIEECKKRPYQNYSNLYEYLSRQVNSVMKQPSQMVFIN